MKEIGGLLPGIPKMRILIADDSIVSRHLLEATLRKWGYETVVTSDGSEAWNILEGENAPRVAILDWVMPGMTGPEVCKRVRAKALETSEDADANYTYVLLLTSKNQKEDLIEGMESGADDYVTKPFDQHELKVRLRAGTRIVELQAKLFSAREELRDQATRDFLTRLWNRSAIFATLTKELNRANREKRSVGIVLADIDRFKSINDTFGHQAGDTVLREFARRMEVSIRPYDAIGRYGGEEFLAVLPGCDEHCLPAQAERLRGALASPPMQIGEVSHTVTCSFGATVWQPGMSTEPEALVRIADEALYMAKNQGRNRTVYLAADALVRND